MILVVGAFELFPLLALLLVALVAALPAALGWSVLAGVFHNPLLASAAGLGMVGLVSFVAEKAARARGARRDPEWVCSLSVLGESPGAKLESIGGKAKLLARLHALGAPVPPGMVLTTQLVERIAAAKAMGKGIDRIFGVLPSPAKSAIEAFLAQSKGKVIVRASFTDHGPKHSYAGVFPAVRDVDPGNPEELVSAVLSLLAASDDPIGREYRKRRGAPLGVARAVVVERQVDAEITGQIASRGPAGRADSVIVDFARKRSPTRSYRYDLVEGRAELLGGDERFETPAWMHRLAILAVTLEEELGFPVVFEFAMEGEQPYVIDVRATQKGERKTWVHAAPLDASGERSHTFAHELRGGLPLVRKVLERMLARAGAAPTVQEDEVRYVDGLVYVDAEVLRRALSRLGADVLLRGGLRATLRAIAPVRRRPLPNVPQVTEITPSAWRSLRRWHDRHLLGAAHVRLELVAREWMIKTLVRLLDGTGQVAEDRRGHPALRFVLVRRVRQASEEATRQLEVLEKAEAELGSAVARLLVRGAQAWNAMFKGDRHLFATLEEIDRWHDDAPGRDAIETTWRSRGTAFDQRKGEPIVARVHRPALPAAGTEGRGVLAGVGVVAGTARGPAVIATGSEKGIAAGAILLVPEPRSEVCALLYEARGVVLLSGGVVSKVAVLAAELGVPTVLCSQARSASTRDVAIDGTTGNVTVTS